MADSKRLMILKALTAYLDSEMTEANGYTFTLKRAHRGRMFFTTDDKAPMISVLEDIDPDRLPQVAGATDRIHAGMQKSEWSLLLQGWAPDDAENPTDPAYELMADLTKALAKILKGPDQYGQGEDPNFMLGGLITGMTMEPGIARPPQEGLSSKAFFWKRVRMTIVEDLTDPYRI